MKALYSPVTGRSVGTPIRCCPMAWVVTASRKKGDFQDAIKRDN